MISHTQKQDFRRNEIIFEEDECERLLDIIWEDLKDIRMQKHLEPILFENDIKLNIKVEKNGSFNLMSVDYSQYGNFEPLTINFRYIYIERKRLIIKLPEEKRELMMNLYNFKNDDNVVCFKISESEKYLFRKTFLDSYSDALGIDIEKKVIEEMEAISLLTKVYVDIASKGIISMVEFCYGDKVINPLYDAGFDKGFREAGCENEVLSQLKSYGFKEHGRLFLLDDAEQIMFLLTDKLEGLKKIAEVYYSVDFKKLYVKNLNSLGLSLSEDESVIHMNINLENVSDEELAELLEAIKTGKKYYRLKNGSIVNLGSADSSKLVDLINSLDINKDSINGGIFEIPLNRGVYIDNYLREKNVENVKIDSQLGYLLKRLSNPDDMEVKLNGNLKEVLRNYQMTGVKWLQTMASCSFGGILADDMGLGKTLQVLAFIAAEKCKEQKDGKKPCIVVAPTSIIYNWKSEAEKFTPELKVLVITGLKDKRRLLICGCNDFDLIITSYGALKNDVQDYEKIKFLYIFLDEAQNIKNPATLNANSVKSLSGKCAFALTGTPIENRLMELWSIFDFIMPGLLFDRIKFARIYEDPIMREKDSKKMEELSHIIRPFIIRRMKRDVLSELPEKLEANYLAEMKEEQKKLYAAFYKDFKNELIPKINEFGIGKNHIEIFSALTRLRQICAHPGTFLENYSGGSGKLDLAMDIIYKSIETGHSILLFSQFTKMLKIVRNELEKNNVNYYYLDGKMKPEERMVEIDNFNYDKEAVFLISLKAGGTGLNLTKADVVIHFDPWWNPAVENQASDRAYRIGQKNVVQVYNLLTEGTIEEMIARLKERKRDLFDGVIKSEENFLYQLSEEEIKNLFNLSGGESARNSM
ncbi:snf2/rad54 helicase family [Holotrichia oblita]|nr:snf2/rad54 helicase family [Holotrichia oblita]